MYYYSHNIDDFDRDTVRLSMLQKGAYRLLMDRYYESEKPLPTDSETLWRMCSAVNRAEKMAVSFVAEKFFVIEPDGLHQKRIDAELAHYTTNRGNGGKGGRPRKNNPNRNRDETQPETQTITETDTNIVTKELNNNTPIAPKGADWVPSDAQQRLNRIFRRRDSTPWSHKERKAFKALGEISSEDLDRLERYYTARLPEGKDYRRRDLTTLLNNFHGEVDRARNFKEPSLF
jgi:uncharacterized protein YdaU (DUF1376 family)